MFVHLSTSWKLSQYKVHNVPELVGVNRYSPYWKKSTKGYYIDVSHIYSIHMRTHQYNKQNINSKLNNKTFNMATVNSFALRIVVLCLEAVRARLWRLKFMATRSCNVTC